MILFFLKNNFVPSVHTNTETIPIFNIPLPAYIEQKMPDMSCMYDLLMDVEQQILNI